jgi:hypothetical protein
MIPTAQLQSILNKMQKFPVQLPDTGPLFMSETAMDALERTIAMHFFRTGSFNVAHTFIEVTRIISFFA